MEKTPNEEKSGPTPEEIVDVGLTGERVVIGKDEQERYRMFLESLPKGPSWAKERLSMGVKLLPSIPKNIPKSVTESQVDEEVRLRKLYNKQYNKRLTTKRKVIRRLIRQESYQLFTNMG